METCVPCVNCENWENCENDRALGVGRSLAMTVARGMRDTNNEVMGGMRILISLLAVITVVGCKDAKGKQGPASGSGSALAAPAVPVDAPGLEPIETTWDKTQQYREDVKAEKKAKDLAKGDGQDEEWVPAEHKTGAGRWKDVGVYVDGKPMGFLTWGELPIALKPTWITDRVSAEKRPGTDDPGWRESRQRFYRFDQYLKAIGVDLRKIKEVHVYGPKFSETNISTAKDLLGPKAKDFMFRFGANVGGKPIPKVPAGFGNGKSADKIAGVMVYIKKRPPTLVWNEGLELDGVIQSGVPYFGEPIRGGVRVYRDDKLVTIIKRQELDAAKATKGPDGELTWKLADVLAAQGVDTKNLVEMWVVRGDRREEKFPASDLATITFTASSQAKGGILLTDKQVRANVLALHSRAVAPDEIPVVLPDDE